MDLKQGSFGWRNAKALISYDNEGEFSMKFLSYNFIESEYKVNEFDTYTGSITVFNSERKTENIFFYNSGRLFSSTPEDIDANPLCFYTPPAAPDVNWCLVYPPICNHFGDGGSGNNTTTMLMQEPPFAGGGGVEGFL